MLIVMSILLALGVAAWQSDREISELIERSLTSFANEITQNRNTLDDLYRFHVGLQSLLLDLNVESHPEASDEIRNVLDSFQSTVLLTSAWDTALATGALAEMDYEIVLALSLTYSFQQRFETLYNTRLLEMLGGQRGGEQAAGLAYASGRYIGEVTAAEGELLVVYQQALEVLGVALEEHTPDEDDLPQVSAVPDSP